jgi:PilZ domain-containing protein
MKETSKKQQQPDPSSLRFGQRTTLEVPVRLAVDGRTLGSGTIRNASISGALIETATDLPLNTNLVVTLSPAGGKPRDMRELSACVVRVDPAGIGVEWRDMGCVDVNDLLERACGKGVAG